MKINKILHGISTAFLLIAVVAQAGEARAELITFVVKGEIIGFVGPPLPPFALGQSYIATYTFDSEAVGTPVFGGGQDYNGALVSANFHIGMDYEGSLGSSSASNISVLNDFFGHTDSYSVLLYDVDAPPIQAPHGPVSPSKLVLVTLEDFGTVQDPPTALSSDALPLIPPDPTNFDSAFWFLEFMDEQFYGGVQGIVTSVEFPVKEVSIDIRPNNKKNIVNLGSAGVIPVAILSSYDFDALKVDEETLFLSGANVKLAGRSGMNLCEERDVNRDGLLDLVCNVETAEIFIEPGTDEVELTGRTVDGRMIHGTDTVKIIPD